MEMKKTNALRHLTRMGVDYTIYTYDIRDGKTDGASVAQKTGIAPARMFKTLVAQGASGAYYVCVIPVLCEMDPKKAAAHFGEKKLTMIPQKDLLRVTGYMKGGCSPVGMKKQFATVIDSTACQFETIVVSAGKVGLQMELPPAVLVRATGAEYARITV